jgi:hypothetical protein
MLVPYTIPEQDADLWECGCVYPTPDPPAKPNGYARRDALLAAFGTDEFTTRQALDALGGSSMNVVKQQLESLRQRKLVALDRGHPGICHWRVIP